MKKRIVSLLLALVMVISLLPVSAFAEGEDYDLRVLTFEDADYQGDTNFAGGNDWSSLIDDPQYGGPLLYGSSGSGFSSEEKPYQWTDANNTGLSSRLCNGYGSYCYWSGGHAISNYNTGDIAEHGGYTTQLTVYKKDVSGLSRSGGGHNGSNNFAVHYGYMDGSQFNMTTELPALTFADGAERVIDHMYVTNTTYALNCYLDGNGLTAKIGDDDWVKLVATGYDAAGATKGTAEIYLCNGPDNIIMDWTKWDLSKLGKVNKVTFNVTGSSDNGYGFSQPAYFAYDDVAVRFEKDSSNVPATGVTLDKTELSLTEGESATLTATVAPENATDKAIVWTSSDNAVATVENGAVTAVKAGTATITAACGSAKAECTVTVTGGYELRVLTFEDADYKGGTNFAGGNNWTSLIDNPQYGGAMLYPNGSGTTVDSEAYTWCDTGNTELKHTLPKSWDNYCYWGGGHAVSHYTSSDFETYGSFTYQLTVYSKNAGTGMATSGGGHNGSDNFAVHFGYKDNSGYTDSQVLPSFAFADGVERVIDHMYVNNICYALNCYFNGNDLTAKIDDTDWVKLTATGYNTEGTKTGDSSIYLCNGPKNIITDWTKFDLSGLGKVAKVEFNITGSSDNGYGFSQPAYFAYDDVAVRFEQKGSSDVPATGVTLDKTGLSLTEGESTTLTATVEPENATDKTIVWTSSDNAVATVENGAVTAVKAGTATITAACGSAKAECTVTVTAAPASSLSVKVGTTAYPVKPIDGQEGKYHVAVPYGSNATIEVKDAAFLMVTNSKGGYLNDEGSNPFTLTAAQLDKILISEDIPFTMANSASKVAYLSIMDVMAGTSYELYIELTRDPVPATSVALNETALSLHPTEKATLTAAVKPENTTDTVVWSSSNDAVATVKDGVVTAVKEGTATITATYGSVKAECVVTVLPPILATGVTLDKTTLNLYEGDAARLTATVAPENTTDKTIVWTSSDNAIATVKDGTVTAVKAGTATITAACGEAKAACAVTVKAPVEPAQKNGVYQTGTADELVWFAKQVNSGNTAISATLTGDVDLSGINWTPIGSSAKKFSGSFDGAGYAIKNLTINYQTAKSGESLYLGLFGYVEGTKDNRAAIKNLTVQGSVNANSEFSVYTGDVAGVVAYGNYVDISGVISRVNVTVDAKVGNACGVGGLAGLLKGSTVTNCGNEGNVSGVKNLGGLCYELYAGTMTGCYNTGAVSASGTYVGGLMGYAKQATIKNVYNTGAVSTAKNLVGGLVGVMENSSITNGYSTGKVTVSESGGNAVGAVVGTADTLSNIYYLSGTADKAVGNGDASATAKTDDELKAKAMPAALGNGFKRDLGSVNGGYPVLSWQTSDCKHVWKDGKCETCGIDCKHVWKDGKCETCGIACKHVWKDGKCETCGIDCKHVWKDGKCETCGIACKHSGGTATCKDKAVCEVCQQPYGEMDKSNHTSLKKVDAKDATYTEEGNIAYWYCGDCGKYYSDAEATKEITKADTVIPKKTPSSNPGSNGTGTGSGSTNTGSAGTDANVKKGVKSSNTGDAGIVLYAAMGLLSLTGGAVVLGRKRKDD